MNTEAKKWIIALFLSVLVFGMAYKTLYLDLSRVIDLAEHTAYRNSSDIINLDAVRVEFEKFCAALAQHEQDEMELIMQLCNQDIGVGD